LPIQIIQRNIANISEDTAPYMPTLRAKIKRIRNAEMAAQPQTLEDINIPESLQSSLNGDQFLKERILLFTIKANIRNLSQALFWVMDGTYKTVPNVFYQLYTIHAPVGAEDNFRILPLVYALMTSKAEEVYKQLFKDLNDFADENDVELMPSTIITDFEKGSINASQYEFPGVNNKGCFFHLSQSGWRKIQEAGLASQYGTDKNLSFMLRHLFALAFLPADDISNAFDGLIF